MTTSDLFAQFDELRDGIAANCGLRNSRPLVSGVNCAYPANAGDMRIFIPTETLRATPNAPKPRNQSKKKDNSGVRARLSELAFQEEEAARAVSIAQAIAQQLKVEFEKSDQALRDLHARRKAGHFVARSTMIRAYDDRLNAGHKWNPHRRRLREAKEWHERVRKEIFEVNAELDG